MSLSTFDIFEGLYGSRYAMWIEAVNGLAAAKERMDEIASGQPGKYFVFCARKHKSLASTDTTAPARASQDR